MNELDTEPRLRSKGNPPVSQLLVAFIKDRDQAAFSQLVRLYGPLVYGVCRRVVGNHHDAEDAFQATFLVLAQKAASIQNREALFGWLFRVAFQVSLRAKSSANLRRKKEQPMSETNEPVTSDPAVWFELEPVLDQELNGLSEKYRLPVLLCDLEGCTQNEAATKLGWSLGTLSTRLTKARSILAERLTRRGLTLSTGAIAVLLSENGASAGFVIRIDNANRRCNGIRAGGIFKRGHSCAGNRKIDVVRQSQSRSSRTGRDRDRCSRIANAIGK